MLEVTYRFPVLPRYRSDFQQAWYAARDALEQALGLMSFELILPRERRAPHSLRMHWDSQASFERFTRTWVGVWMLNGMGLVREAFFAPIDTEIDGRQHFQPRVGKRAA